MKLGIRKEKYNDLMEINNLLKFNEGNTVIKTPDFQTRLSEITNPHVENKFVPLLFELRGNYEISAIGGIADIIEFFKLTIVEEVQNGYILGVHKEGEDEVKRNPKSYKYFANLCNYDSRFTSKLKRDYFKLEKNEQVYFYRSGIFLMNESETVELLKEKMHYSNFDKFAIHTIRRQKKFHKIFNLPYKLNLNVTIIDESIECNEESSLRFNIEDDNSISLTGKYSDVCGFIEPEEVNITFSIPQINNLDKNQNTNMNKKSFRDLFISPFKTMRRTETLVQ